MFSWCTCGTVCSQLSPTQLNQTEGNAGIPAFTGLYLDTWSRQDPCFAQAQDAFTGTLGRECKACLLQVCTSICKRPSNQQQHTDASKPQEYKFELSAYDLDVTAIESSHRQNTPAEDSYHNSNMHRQPATTQSTATHRARGTGTVRNKQEPARSSKDQVRITSS